MSEIEDLHNFSTGGLWIVLARAFRSMQALVERSIASLGIGLSDFMILEALAHGGPRTMSELCKKVLLANASMTYAVDRLEKKGLVYRLDISEDRRTRCVSLTTEGRDLIDPLFARHIKDIEAVMRHVPPADRAEARRILKVIGFAADARLKQMDEKAKAKAKAKKKTPRHEGGEEDAK